MLDSKETQKIVQFCCEKGSLRSKRFRRAFRPLEAFFAFWLRKNWGERTNFPAAKKAKSASNVRKALPKRLLRRLRKRWLSLIGVTTIAIKCLSFLSRCCHLSLDRDVSTSYCQSSSGGEVDWLDVTMCIKMVSRGASNVEFVIIIIIIIINFINVS